MTPAGASAPVRPRNHPSAAFLWLRLEEWYGGGGLFPRPARPSARCCRTASGDLFVEDLPALARRRPRDRDGGFDAGGGSLR